ncbi:MAG: hypothetical protein ACRDLT_16890 [Solirubrobacteraceae bacterium]
MARRVMIRGAVAGLVGGLGMIVVMILVMGTTGSGYASPLNLGMPGFVYTITPPVSMLPKMMMLMGIHLPASAMTKLGPAIASGHIPPMMVHQLGMMLQGMHVPAAKVHMMGQLMTGTADNKTVADLLSSMSPSARSAIMGAMPVAAGRVVVGTVLHFAFAAFLGTVFAVLILAVGIRRLRIPGLGTVVGIVGVSIVGGAIVYAVNRWLILPPTNPMLGVAPQTAFFISHLVWGLGVGLVLALVAQRSGLLTNATPGHGHVVDRATGASSV